MKKIRRIGVALTLALISFAAVMPAAAADDHIVSSSIRTYMGRTNPPQTSDMWIAADKICIKMGRINLITRQDLGVRWIIAPQFKRYLEEPLTAAPASAKSEEKFRIQEYGFDDVPKYDWAVKATGETQVIDGKSCVKFIAAGEADYSSEIREHWVTKDVPIDLKRYYQKAVLPDAGEEWRAIYERTPALKEGFLMKTITTRENPIAPTMVFELKVTLVETTTPPSGIYDVPQGFQKVKTREELYAR